MVDINLEVITRLPVRQTFGPQHIVTGIGLMALTVLTHVTPHSPSWIIFRRGIALPFIACGFLYLYWVPIVPEPEQQWGNAIGCFSSIVRLIEWTFFTAETHCFRVIPKDPVSDSSTHLQLDQKADSVEVTPTAIVPQPVPKGFTRAKVDWAFSLFVSARGIGWNYSPPLPQTSMVHPFLRTSKRRPYILAQLRTIVITLLVHDTTRYFISYVAPDFFTGKILYDDLSMGRKAVYSIITASRAWYITQQSTPGFSIILVGLGGVLGWEGEVWSPWGNPPFFGGLTELWRSPGLSTMWSKTWHAYWRRFLHVVGWIGIGEKILRLPPTGLSSHSHTRPRNPVIDKVPSDAIPTKLLATSTQRPSAVSRRPSEYDTPSHPLETTLSRRLNTRIALANFVKSVIVFTITGLLHDVPFLLTHLNKTHPVLPKSIPLSDWLVVTPFFVAQPFAIVVEAVIKRLYRRMKAARGIKLGTEPSWLVTIERTVGFFAVWVWLGWSARAYVSGMARLSVMNWHGFRSFSLTSGLLKEGGWTILLAGRDCT